MTPDEIDFAKWVLTGLGLLLALGGTLFFVYKMSEQSE